MIRLVIGGEIFEKQWFNWNEETKTVSRSETYHGCIITKTIQIQVIEDAYKKVKAEDDLNDLAGELDIKTQIFDSVNGWVDDFIGFVDFESISYDTNATVYDNNTDKTPVNKLTFNAYSSNFANKLIERQKIKIPYDRLETLDGQVITPFANEYHQVNIDGIEVISVGNADFELGQLQDPNLGFVDNFWPTVTMDGNNSELKSTFQYANCNIENFDSSVFSYYANDTDAKINIKLKLDYFYTEVLSGGVTSFYIQKAKKLPEGETNTYGKNIDLATISTPLFTQSANGGGGVPVYNNVDIDIEVDIEEGYGLYFILSRVVGGCLGGPMEIESNDLTQLNIREKALPTPCNFVPPFEMGTRIIESITGQSNGLDSPYLGRTDSPTTYDEDGNGSLYFRTNGRLIRQFPTGYITTDSDKKSQLTDSLLEWFESIDKIFCLGAGVKFEDGQYKFYVDDRKEFYKSELSYEFSLDDIEVDSFNIEKDMSLYYNQIKVGSKYEKTEEVSGLEEYNSSQEYSSPIPNDNEYDLNNSNIYAAYPYEFTRRNKYESEQTTDYKYDGNNFIFNVERDGGGGYQQLSDTNFDEINGLKGITTYINLNITPQRIIIKYHDWYVNSGFKGYQSDKLTYNESEMVTDLSTRKIGEANVIVENSNILISSLSSPKFTGKKITFTASISSDDFKKITDNPYGLMAYPDIVNGGIGYGYIPRGGEISSNLVDKTTNVELWETIGFSDTERIRLLQDGNYRLLEDGGLRLLED
jgi:hypothetical protein